MNKIISGALFIGVTMLLTACNHHKETAEIASTKFCLTDSLKVNLELSTAQVQHVKNQLLLSGKVSAYEDKMVKVYPVVSGVIEDLKIELGDYVTAGQPLAIIRSGEAADIETQLINAQSQLINAQKSKAVADDLFKAGLNNERDVVSAGTDLKKAESELAKVKDLNNLYGVKNSRYTIKAPISGYVIYRNPDISEKMQFNENEVGAFFSIADLSQVIIEGSVYETDIEKVREGLPVSISLLAYPDSVFIGKIDKVFSVLDPTSRTMKVRVKMDNKKNLLKPEMFARLAINYEGANTMIAVDAKAIIFDKNKYFAMVYKDDCNIETREVKVFQTTDNTTYLSNGLQEGERIMSRNQLLVYDQLND
jgi:cobalt-zinc-cadmium efflux system membrane fusion protein